MLDALFSFRKRHTIPTPGPELDDVAHFDAGFLEIGGSSTTLNGLQPSTTPCFIVNVGDGAVTIAHLATSSQAKNRFANVVESDLELEKGSAALAWYDSTRSQWKAILLGGGSSGGGGGGDGLPPDYVVDSSGNTVVDSTGNVVIPS
jgi:hypothetical protein